MKQKQLPPPALRLSSLIVKQLIDDKGKTVTRYFFRWSDRRELKAILLRVQLYAGSEPKPFQTCNAQLGKIESFIQGVGNIYVDVPEELPIADSFGYYTASVFKKSAEFRDVVTSKREDLRHEG